MPRRSPARSTAAAWTTLSASLTLTAGFTVTACGSLDGPTLSAAAEAPADLLIDGMARPNPSELPYRYYGTTELRSLPPPPGADGELPYAPATTLHEVPAPAPKWLFPLDLLLEVVALPWRQDRASVMAPLPPNPGLVPNDDTTPRGIPELAERARRARAGR